MLEVLCSGEETSGKLLMHFLLYYGEHYDANTTAVDVSGKHNSGFHYRVPGMTSTDHLLSPFIPKMSKGTIDPITGMLTVDPIVIYDAIPGRETSNVARSCFAWANIRWNFAHCYMTLCSAVERTGTTRPTSLVTGVKGQTVENPDENGSGSIQADGSADPAPTVSHILEQLLAF